MTQEIVASAVTPPRMKTTPSSGFKVVDSLSPQFPYIIVDTFDQIFGLVMRLMDEKRTDATPFFAVTYEWSGNWNLWLNRANKEYLIRSD